jgi:hypothetical protein
MERLRRRDGGRELGDGDAVGDRPGDMLGGGVVMARQGMPRAWAIPTRSR